METVGTCGACGSCCIDGPAASGKTASPGPVWMPGCLPCPLPRFLGDLAYAAASWVGAHQVAETPALFRIFTSKTGHQWSQPMHQCTACSMLVARNRLPVEVCPAYKGNCKPTSSAKRKREWKTFRKEASKSTRRTPQRKRKQPTS